MAVEARLKVVPYSRCKYMVLSGQVAACFNMSWQPEFQDKIKLAARPIFDVSNDVFESIKAPLPKPPVGQCILRSQLAGDGLECAVFIQFTRVIVNDHRWQASSHRGPRPR